MADYKYYILDLNNKNVMGVLKEDEQGIHYHDLTIIPTFNVFQNQNVDELLPYYESPVRVVDKDTISKNIDKAEMTKDYWKAFHHARGGKRKAVAPSSEF